MKTPTIASTLATLSLGALLSACGGAEPITMSDHELMNDDVAATEGRQFDQLEQPLTVCDDQQYDHWRYLSALAVATANELGRWKASEDFQLSNGMVTLSPAGLARCENGCDNIKAILELQNGYTSILPRHDPNLLKQYLVAFYDRQVNYDRSNPGEEHELIPSHVTNAECGLRYHYEARKAPGASSSSNLAGGSELKALHSGKCMDVYFASTADGAIVHQYACTGGSNQRFTLESQGGGKYRLKANHSGKCLAVTGGSSSEGAQLEQRSCNASNAQMFYVTDKGNQQFEIKNVASNRCMDVRYWSQDNFAVAQQSGCHGGNNQRFIMTGVGSSSSSGSSGSSSGSSGPLNNPSDLRHRLKFAGEHQNAYLAFQFTSTQVSIDPMGTMVDGGSTAQSGSCVYGSTIYDPSRTSSNKCCISDGRYGKLQQSTFNRSLYYCR